MTDQDLIERITRSLAYMLRHRPERFDLELDAHGYGDLDEVVRAVSERLGEDVEADDLRDAVEAGTRRRYEIRDDTIRALYGHSIPIEPGPDCEPPDVLYLGLPSRDVERAQRNGLRGGRRSYLHLALSEADARESGRRLARDYTILRVLAIDAWEEGINFFDRQALFLAERIPTEFLEIAGEYDDGEDPEPRRGGGGDGGRRSGGQRGRSRGGRGGRGRWSEGEDSGREESRGRGRQDSRPSRDESSEGRGSRRRPVSRDHRDEEAPRRDREERPREDREGRGGRDRDGESGRGRRGASRSSERPRTEDRDSEERPRSRPRREPSRTAPERKPAASKPATQKPAEAESSEGFGLGIFEEPAAKAKPARSSRTAKARSKPKPEPEAAPEPAPKQEPADDGFGFGVGL